MNIHNKIVVHGVRTAEFASGGFGQAKFTAARSGQRLAAAAVVALAGLCLSQTAAGGQTVAAVQPAEPSGVSQTAAAGQKLPIFVRSIQGKAIFRKLPGNEAISAKVGDTIDENTEVMTGQNATIQIQVGSGQVFTIDRGSKVLVRSAININGKETTKLEVPAGRIGFDVARVAGDNDVEIKAPDATLAVKGTTGYMDVTPGQPTSTRGGDFNTGQFNMLYNSSNAMAKVTGSKKSTSTLIAVVKTETGNLFVDAGDKSARSGDEKKFVEDHTSHGAAADSTVKVIDSTPVYAKGPGYYEGTVKGNILARLDLSGIAYSQQDGYGGFSVSPAGGVAVTNGRNIDIYTVENVPGGQEGKGGGGGGAFTPVIRVITVKPGSFSYRAVTSFPETGTFGRSSWYFNGLAKMGRDFYTSGTTYTDFGTKGQQVESGQIYMLATLGSSTSVATPRMNLGIDLQHGLAGDSSRGSLFVTGSVPGTTFGFGGTSSAIIMQVDPRNNLIQNAWSNQPISTGAAGRFSAASGSAFGGMDAITGLAMVNGSLVITGTNGSGTAVRGIFSPYSGSGRGAIGPSTAGGNIGTAFSLGGSSTAPNPANLIPVGSAQTPARDDINLLFSSMAYTTAARRSGVIEMIVKQQILSTASDREGCARSGDLSLLSGILGLYDNQRSGIGLSVAEFRRVVMVSGHQHCLPPSMLGGRQ